MTTTIISMDASLSKRDSVIETDQQDKLASCWQSHTGKWDGTTFSPARNAYQKFLCTFKFKRMVRTHYKCNENTCFV